MSNNKCTKVRLKKIKYLGIDTNGSVHEMEAIITSNGYGLPCELIEEDATEWVTVFDSNDQPFEELQIVPRHYYWFTLHHVVTYTRITFTYVDSLAEEVILLKTLKLI